MIWIENNIAWIKDCFMVVFAGVATVLSILTYKRARFTILQPVRSEVIKRQADLITELFDLVGGSEVNNKIGYEELINLNITSQFMYNGFEEFTTKEMITDYKKNNCGFFIEKTFANEYLAPVNLIEPINTRSSSSNPSQKDMEVRRNRCKKGIVIIEFISIGKIYNQFKRDIKIYIYSPLIPEQIKIILKDLLLEIERNVSETMKLVFEEALREFFKAYYLEHKNVGLASGGVENLFESKMVRHERNIKKLKNEIQKYLHINERWT